MARQHSKKQIRAVLTEAADAGLNVQPKPHTRGHSWGYIQCEPCKEFRSVWTTPKNVEAHAADLRRFVNNHRHQEHR